MQEIYKDIPNWVGLYQVSNLGNVKSLPKGIRTGNANRSFLLKQEITKSKRAEYNRVTFCKNGKTKRYSVHRLVAQAFILNPDNKPQVNHIDNTGTNNQANNLEWVTGKENMAHSAKQGRQIEAQKAGCKAAKAKLQKQAEEKYKNILGNRFIKTYTTEHSDKRVRLVEYVCLECKAKRLVRSSSSPDVKQRKGVCHSCALSRRYSPDYVATYRSS